MVILPGPPVPIAMELDICTLRAVRLLRTFIPVSSACSSKKRAYTLSVATWALLSYPKAADTGSLFLILLKQLKKRNVEKNIRIIKLSQPANDPSRALILDKTLRKRKDDTKMVSCKVTDRKQVCPQRRKIEYIMKNPG